jgi:hypothetical protein
MTQIDVTNSSPISHGNCKITVVVHVLHIQYIFLTFGDLTFGELAWSQVLDLFSLLAILYFKRIILVFV